MLPLQIHPIKLLMKSINHDLAFNASFFCAKRCICEYIKSGRCSATVEVSLRFSEASNVISRWRCRRSRRSLENQKLNFPYSGLLIISFNALKINLWSLGLLATVLYK
ncbi:hypothetical protein HID58_018612 [Brassica napus]|uniref:Uncharacterized protein n=1 Tax=Brassica napus TaxID=3708 RepID=A0ABQ8DAE9_BRANA|nr:hypothetical protein HID58_018612 [Brassica napus]